MTRGGFPAHVGTPTENAVKNQLVHLELLEELEIACVVFQVRIYDHHFYVCMYSFVRACVHACMNFGTRTQDIFL
jgi:hypothetical protein